MHPRHQQILDFVQLKRKVPTAELASRFQVSEVTIRQDLNKLERLGLIKRVHGAAIPSESDSLAQRLNQNYSEKLAVARLAASDVPADAIVFIEGGSTNALLAKTLGERGDVSIVTVSAFIANELRHTSVNVTLLGGLYQHESQSMVGALTRLCILNTPFTHAFIGVDGIDLRQGLTSRDMARADVVQALASKGGRVNVLATSGKFNKVEANQLLRLDQVATVYCQQALAPEQLQAFDAAGAQVRWITT